MFIGSLINKWLHLASAATVVGGLMYLSFILYPLGDTLPEGRNNAGWQAAYRKSFRLMLWAILILLLTGLDNIMKARKTLVLLPPEQIGAYWSVFWTKMALFAVCFFLVHALYVRVPAFTKFREKPQSWTNIFLVAALAILFCSGYLTVTRLSLLKPPPAISTTQ